MMMFFMWFLSLELSQHLIPFQRAQPTRQPALVDAVVQVVFKRVETSASDIGVLLQIPVGVEPFFGCYNQINASAVTGMVDRN